MTCSIIRTGFGVEVGIGMEPTDLQLSGVLREDRVSGQGQAPRCAALHAAIRR